MQGWAVPKDALCITLVLAEDNRGLTEWRNRDWMGQSSFRSLLSGLGKLKDLLVVVVGCRDGVPVCFGVAQPRCSDVRGTKGELQGDFLCSQQPWEASGSRFPNAPHGESERLPSSPPPRNNRPRGFMLTRKFMKIFCVRDRKKKKAYKYVRRMCVETGQTLPFPGGGRDWEITC